MTESVLAHIAGAIPQKENLATEALAFILNRSADARRALSTEMARLLEQPVPIAHVATQVAVGDESRPDLVLRDENARLLGFVEAKFWAALTVAQPVEYIRRLEDGNGGALVMLAPERRLPTLRAEVLDRCRAAGLATEARGAWLLRVDRSVVGLLSWSRLLSVLVAATVDEPATSSDLRQLAGVCGRFESEGFIPLTRDVIDDLETPRRVLAFANLVNDIVEKASRAQVLFVRGLKATHYLGATGRYAAFAHAGVWIGLSHWQWLARGRSPLWVRFRADEWGRGNQLREAFRSWATQDPPRADLDGEDRAVRIPLLLRTGVEKEAVVDDAVAQLREIDAVVRGVGLPPLTGEAPKEG